MSTFSEVLTEYIKAKHVKVAPMTKYCGIDRSTMYKLIVVNAIRRPKIFLKKWPSSCT